MSSVPSAIETQSVNSPWERDQNKVEPHRAQNSRSTDSEEEYLVMCPAPLSIRSALRGTLPYEANAAP
ncbi:hypothetical protein D3C84_442400 [compost metagenome]